MRAYPDKLFWPVYGDMANAKKLIDAVINEDIEAMQALKSMYPEYDLGLNDYLKRVRGQFVIPPKAQLMKTITYANGIRLDVTLEEGTPETGAHLVGTIRRGGKTIARHIITTER